MTVPTGTFGLKQHVGAELGLSGTVSLAQSQVRTLAGIPSGTINMRSLAGKSNIDITPDAVNFNDMSAFGYPSGGYQGGNDQTISGLTAGASITLLVAATGYYSPYGNSGPGSCVQAYKNGAYLGNVLELNYAGWGAPLQYISVTNGDVIRFDIYAALNSNISAQLGVYNATAGSALLDLFNVSMIT